MASSSEDEDNISVEKYFNSLYIPYKKIKSSTNNFADENLLAQGTIFKVYKGQLSQSAGNLVNIVVRETLHATIVFNELINSKNINHKNIVIPFKCNDKFKDDHRQLPANNKREQQANVSLFKFNNFTSEGTIVFMINKHEANGSLDKHLSGTALTWRQRLNICVRVAHALKYLHYDAAKYHYVIHGNIKSSKILLDENWEPKLHGFGYALKGKKHQLQFTSKYNGALQYMDPAYENTRGLTHKSDVFSFGVLLFEVLFGREASIQNNDNWYFARLARSRYEEGRLDDMINPDLRKQMSLESLNMFSETAYYCLKELRTQRLDMIQVFSRLEKALELQLKHECPTDNEVESTSSNHLQVILQKKSLSHLKFRLSDIELATNNFSEACCIGSGGYGKVYKAKLEHFDDLGSLVVEGENKSVFPKKHSIVAIKRISSRIDGRGEEGFFAEIEMLSNCRHPNIVSFLGFCDERSEMILVYEYVSNGSLDDCLRNINNMNSLTWAQRIQICLDIAHGLNYLHTSTKEKQTIIHRDIKSANILLDDNWVAKIADFGLSKLHHLCAQRSTMVTQNIAGTEVYLDPEYMSTGRLKCKSDVYSFGVVLFEMMCGKVAYDTTYNEKGLPSAVRQHFNEGTLKELVDPKMKEVDENISMLIGGVNQHSLDTFSKVAYQCLAETQSKRPTMEVVIKELMRALNFQVRKSKNLHISLEDISSGTQNFSDCKCIGSGRFWKLYEGEVALTNGYTPIIAKRWSKKSDQRQIQFLTELDIVFKYKHKNIVALVGYCNEMDENIIVYEHASNGRLDKHLCDPSVTWMKRLKICIDVANGLEFLHNSSVQHEDSIIHRDITSGSILLDGDWNAKIYNFELSCKMNFFNRAEHLDDNDCNSLGYIDPQYKFVGFLREHSDIYSLGVILLEVLCGRMARVEGCEDHSQSLGPLAVRHYNEKGNLHEMVFENIKEQIVPLSLATFAHIALKCLKDEWEDRPSASDVVKQLTNALKFQEDYDVWEPKLPKDYKEIIQMSKNLEINNSMESKKDLYDMFSKGILLQNDKVLFSFGPNGERNEMISARMFSYKNRTSYRWQSVQESRFSKVAEMLDISNLKIHIKITTQFLAPGVNYGAYIIFKFCDARKFSSKPMYVNLKYNKRGEESHAYFATWRDNDWMMIELCRFLTHKKDTSFQVTLASFSQYYCGKCSIYIEGVEFRVVTDHYNRMKSEEIEDQQVLKIKPLDEKMILLNELNEKKHLILSAKEVLYDYPNAKHFHLKPSTESRSFQEVIELLPQQVLRISCKIRSQMLSRDTEYLCYLVFKLSKKCRGLYCPVKVRGLHQKRNKLRSEAEIVYFRSPSPWNIIHENINTSIPRKREDDEDGWMEVKVWRFNSNQLKNGCISVNLKLISYEGTMSGLLLCCLEFQPM
ncbi:hypothetical protein R6Q57_004028 [Mikania cordata]